VIVIDPEYRIQVVNRPAQDLLGQSAENLIGADLASMVRLPAALTESVQAGQRSGDYEVVWPGKNGQVFADLSASPLADEPFADLLGVV
jgi:PAS domain-containing protein